MGSTLGISSSFVFALTPSFSLCSLSYSLNFKCLHIWQYDGSEGQFIYYLTFKMHYSLYCWNPKRKFMKTKYNLFFFGGFMCIGIPNVNMGQTVPFPREDLYRQSCGVHGKSTMNAPHPQPPKWFLIEGTTSCSFLCPTAAAAAGREYQNVWFLNPLLARSHRMV